MSLGSDLRVLYNLAFTRVKGDNHAERLEAFYRQQAGAYDEFRKRLLHGREEMMHGLEIRPGDRMLDIGGGTGSNVEALADRLSLLQSLHIVDLCPSLLKTAGDRIQRHGWTNVYTVQADATVYEPEGGLVDLITFSYSLTMMPTWLQVLERAFTLLKPGGMIGVADFTISHKWPGPGRRRHSAFQRFMWPMWFGWDNVFLNPDHVHYLQHRFQTVQLIEDLGKVPYLLGLKAPYYVFLGRKPN
jgi:S-adenosylmethionine-diacylgycerolhomoserine-N-methlytransferase